MARRIWPILVASVVVVRVRFRVVILVVIEVSTSPSAAEGLSQLVQVGRQVIVVWIVIAVHPERARLQNQ